MQRWFLGAMAAACLAAGPAGAHHSLAIYDRLSSKTIEGVIKTFGWSNPHVQFVVLAQGTDGTMQQWNFESSSINRLANAGFNRRMVAPGDKVTVTYNPRRDSAKGGFLVSITAPDGHKYDARRNRGPTRGGAEEG